MANKNMSISFEKAKFVVMEDGELIIREELKDEEIDTPIEDVVNMFIGLDGLAITIKHKDML